MRPDDFQDKYTLAQRRNEFVRIMSRHPQSVPVIVQPKCMDTVDIDKSKFVVPKDLEYCRFLYVIRTRLKMRKDQAIFMFVENRLPAASKTIGSIHDAHASEDGFLYLTYAFENTFG